MQDVFTHDRRDAADAADAPSLKRITARRVFFTVPYLFIENSGVRLYTLNKEKSMTPNDILHDSIGFWLRCGPDRENGGIYTSLGRDGEVYSSDKSVWMQGRAAWTFARYARLYPESRFAEEAAGISRSCADFAERYCRDMLRGGRMYFTVTADGKPLRRRRYHFSESFFAMAVPSCTGYPARNGTCVSRETHTDLSTGLNGGSATRSPSPPKTDRPGPPALALSDP